MYDDPYLTFGLATAAIAGCSTIGGCIAYAKRRSPLEGVLLGLFLGPIGVFIECRYPYSQRPLVDKNAWDSLRSMMIYQRAGREPDGFGRQSRRSKRLD